MVRRTFWLIKMVPTWKKFEKRWCRLYISAGLWSGIFFVTLRQTKKNFLYEGEKLTKDKLIVVITILSFKLHYNYICKELLLQLILWKIRKFLCHKYFWNCLSIERNMSVCTNNFCALNNHCLTATQFLLCLKNSKFKIGMKYIT